MPSPDGPDRPPPPADTRPHHDAVEKEIVYEPKSTGVSSSSARRPPQPQHPVVAKPKTAGPVFAAAVARNRSEWQDQVGVLKTARHSKEDTTAAKPKAAKEQLQHGTNSSFVNRGQKHQQKNCRNFSARYHDLQTAKNNVS